MANVEQHRRKRPRPSVVDLTSSPPGAGGSSREAGNSSLVITRHILPDDYSQDATPEPTSYSPESSNPPSPEPDAPNDSGTQTSNQDLLGEYNCPICFCPPTNPCLTPCGHVMCGQCLFSAVKANLKRAGVPYAGPRGNAANPPRCPMCRSPLPKWDGQGRGIIPLKEAKESLPLSATAQPVSG